MRLFLDCEFNGFKGHLISMALVSDQGHEWYEVLHCQNPVDWVAEHVMPILFKPPSNPLTFPISLQTFLSQFTTIHIVADWPEDIQHFCNSLITGPGQRINTPPLTLEVLRIDSFSEIPHNALHDARGIRNEVLKHEDIDQKKPQLAEITPQINDYHSPAKPLP
jgi:hypothetical protein